MLKEIILLILSIQSTSVPKYTPDKDLVTSFSSLSSCQFFLCLRKTDKNRISKTRSMTELDVRSKLEMLTHLSQFRP